MPAVVLSVPLAYEANAGYFQGRVPRGTDAVLVLADGHPVARVRRKTRGPLLRVGPVGLPAGDHRIEVRALRGRTVVGRATVAPVYGLPRSAMTVAGPRKLDRPLRSQLARLRNAAGPGVATGIWVAHLGTAKAASWNAGAQMPAASTLKLAILLTTLSRETTDPLRGGLWSTYERLILDSSNRAANELIARMGGGSVVNGFMEGIGATGTDMYGGYLLEPGEAPVRPGDALVRTTRTVPPDDTTYQPSFTYGKHTTAHDLGILAFGLVRAAAAAPPLTREGITPREARVALWLLLHARYPGLFDPATGSPVGHKAGWLGEVQHDAAIVFTRQGPLVIAGLTYRASGVDYSASARWAALALRASLKRLSTP